MTLKQQAARYPENPSFWNSNTAKLQIINEEDFPLEEILKHTGLVDSELKSGFGNCDEEEARRRSQIFEFLHENPEIRAIIYRLEEKAYMPTSGSIFMDYYNPNLEHNPFWFNLLKLKTFLSTRYKKLPPVLKDFCDTIYKFSYLEKEEDQMGKIIGELLSDTAVFEGFGELDIKINETFRQFFSSRDDLKMESFHGHRTFSFALSEFSQRSMPGWLLKNDFQSKLLRSLLSWNYGKIIRNFIEKENQRLKAKAYEMMDIKCDDNIEYDLKTAVLNILNADDSARELLIKELTENEKLKGEATIKFAFSYGKSKTGNGLKIMLYDIEAKTWDNTVFYFELLDFDGYSKERKYKIRDGRNNLNKEREKSEARAFGSVIKKKLMDSHPQIFFKQRLVKSPYSDKIHKWKALENFYQMPKTKSSYQKIQEFKRYIQHRCTELKSMTNLLAGVSKKAGELKTDICFPEILASSANHIEFKELYPLHLTVKQEKVVPINNLPVINGSMIGLTGRHGGGKTVTEHTVTGNIYLALSGIPIFGKEFKLNPKTHLGMVFIEGVSGQSVCQLLVHKMHNVLKEIKDIEGKNVVLVLDELGSATQDKDGMSYALDILEHLHKKGISVLFSTQTLDVAHQAEELFNAKCFKVDKNHRLQPGISGGELFKIVRESGLAAQCEFKRLKEIS